MSGATKFVVTAEVERTASAETSAPGSWNGGWGGGRTGCARRLCHCVRACVCVCVLGGMLYVERKVPSSSPVHGDEGAR